MTNNQSSPEDVLSNQIRQLREIIVSHKNMDSRSVSIEPTEMMVSLINNLGENESVHPRLLSLDNGANDIEEMETVLKRLENDLQDYREINGQESMYDPHKHELEGESEAGKDPYNDQKSKKTEDNPRPQNMRDKEQRPLSAYSKMED
jgi:hypothetical protein